ncbi:MAG: hypothetical protein QXH07_02435 [Thermoplasmata archaeon]
MLNFAYLKIDYDGKSIDKYIKQVYPILEILSYGAFSLSVDSVYKTKHGWHIYYNVKYIGEQLMHGDLLLLEALLGSDLRKEAICLVEGTNILFEEKKGFKRKPDDISKKKIAKMLSNIYSHVHTYTNETIILKRINDANVIIEKVKKMMK